jgi:hypothetical protein
VDGSAVHSTGLYQVLQIGRDGKLQLNQARQLGDDGDERAPKKHRILF